MKNQFLKISFFIFFIQVCNAENVESVNIHSEYIDALKLGYSIDKFCQPETDNCNTIVTLTSEGNAPIKISGLEGPIFVSAVNKQVFSCETNTFEDRQEAKLFDLEGVLKARIRHRGDLRDCGVTADGKLYWLHYNKVENSKPINVLLVASDDRKLVFEQDLTHGDAIKFQYAGKEYMATIREPEWPG